MSAPRVTNQSMSANVLADNQATLARVARLQEELATGKRVNRVSDDPAAARQSLRLRVDDGKIASYQDNIDRSLSFINASDDAYTGMAKTFDDVKKLAVQGANGTEDASSRAALAEAVDQSLTNLVGLANTAQDGKYLFGGTATTGKPPFAQTAQGVAYQGDLGDFHVQISPTASEAVNRNGYDLFKGSVDVFGAVQQIRDALKANDPGQVRALLTKLDDAASQVNALHGSVGGQVKRLQATQQQLTATHSSLAELISKAEDADLPATIADLQLAQTALQAGLQTGAQVLKHTLLDYL